MRTLHYCLALAAITLSCQALAADDNFYLGTKGGVYLDWSVADASLGIYSGYWFRNWLAAELEVMELDDRSGSGSDRTRIEGGLYIASIVPRYRINDHFDVFAKISAAHIDFDRHFEGGNERQHTRSQLLAGLGVGVRLAPVHLRLELQSDSITTGFASISLGWDF